MPGRGGAGDRMTVPPAAPCAHVGSPVSSPPPDSFDPDDVPFDPDDPLAPKEPGFGAARGPAALLDPDTRGRIEHEILYQQTKVALAAAVPRDAARLPAPVFLPVFVLALAAAAAAAGSVRQAA